MNAFYLGMALFLLLTLVAGLWRVLRGPTPADRMLAARSEERRVGQECRR